MGDGAAVQKSALTQLLQEEEVGATTQKQVSFPMFLRVKVGAKKFHIGVKVGAQKLAKSTFFCAAPSRVRFLFSSLPIWVGESQPPG